MLLDNGEIQELRARVEALEAGSPGAPVPCPTLASEIAEAATKPLEESFQRFKARVDELEAEAAPCPGAGVAKADKKSGNPWSSRSWWPTSGY